jgi:hypothetical protein
MKRLDAQHDVALCFMLQFPELELMSLDEFLTEYETVLTAEQRVLGKAILNLWKYEE